MRKLVIQNDAVTNVIEVEDDAFTLDGRELVPDEGQAQIGWTRVAGVFVEPAPVPVFVPQSITPLQARRQIRAEGLKHVVDAYISALSEEVQEEWEYCVVVNRANGLLVDVLQRLGVRDERLDDFFRNAAKIMT